MKQIKKAFEKYPVLMSVLLLAINFLIVRGLRMLAELFVEFDGKENSDMLIHELFAVAGAFILLFLTGRTDVFSCRGKNFLRGLWSGAVMLVLAVILVPSQMKWAKEEGFTVMKAPIQLAAFVIFVLLIGLAEEIVCRGIITHYINERYGNTASGAVLSVFLGGVMFGFTHITNVLAGQSLQETIVQMIATSLTGILLSAVYIKHRNIFSVIVLHAMLDFMTMFGSAAYQGRYITDPSESRPFVDALAGALRSQGIFLIATVIIFIPYVKKLRRERLAQNPARAAV